MSKYISTVFVVLVFFPVLALAQVPPPVVITTTSLPDGTTGIAVSETLSASGGVTPYTWSATNLPNGLTLDPSTGVISGIPRLNFGWSLPLNTTHHVTFQVQDAVGQIATQ